MADRLTTRRLETDTMYPKSNVSEAVWRRIQCIWSSIRIRKRIWSSITLDPKVILLQIRLRMQSKGRLLQIRLRMRADSNDSQFDSEYIASESRTEMRTSDTIYPKSNCESFESAGHDDFHVKYEHDMFIFHVEVIKPLHCIVWFGKIY